MCGTPQVSHRISARGSGATVFSPTRAGSSVIINNAKMRILFMVFTLCFGPMAVSNLFRSYSDAAPLVLRVAFNCDLPLYDHMLDTGGVLF